jgi:hypothetical protein
MRSDVSSPKSLFPGLSLCATWNLYRSQKLEIDATEPYKFADRVVSSAPLPSDPQLFCRSYRFIVLDMSALLRSFSSFVTRSRVREETLAENQEHGKSAQATPVVDTSATVVTTVRQDDVRMKTIKRLIVLSDGAYPFSHCGLQNAG